MAKTFERLSFLDSSFLALERPNSYMHIAAIQIYEAGPLLREDGGIDIERIRAFVGSKLQYIPRYRQRLAQIPLTGSPVWVDDRHFNLDYHVRHTSLPRPGTEAELKQLAARVFAQQLDRSRPLWELWVVEGLADERFAIVVKVHHSMIDGMAGVDLLKVMLSLWPVEEIEESPSWEPRPVPSDVELIVDETFEFATMPLRAAMRIVDAFGGSGEQARADLRHRVQAALQAARSGWFRRSSATPVNKDLSPHRRFDWLVTSLDEVKYVKNHMGGTVNDVVLATVAGAVRSFMQQRGVDVEALEYRVMAPVSVRSQEMESSGGNQVAMWLVDLPVREADPATRYEAVREVTARLKDDDAALGATVLTQSASWMPLTLLSLGVRLAWNAVHPFNMTVTNVPGPQVPLYLLGSKLVVQYPMVPLWMDHGIGVALFSYEGSIAWGLAADYDLVPDLERFSACIRDALAELHAAAAGRDPDATPRRRTAKRPATKSRAATTKTSGQRSSKAKAASATSKKTGAATAKPPARSRTATSKSAGKTGTAAKKSGSTRAPRSRTTSSQKER